MYREAGAGAGASQALMMAFYRNGFLHGLLPLSDGFRVIRLVVMALTWGITATYIGYIGFAEGIHKSLWVIAYVVIWFGIILLAGVEIFWLELMCILAGMITIAFVTASLLGYLGEVHYEG